MILNITQLTAGTEKAEVLEETSTLIGHCNRHTLVGNSMSFFNVRVIVTSASFYQNASCVFSDVFNVKVTAVFIIFFYPS